MSEKQKALNTFEKGLHMDNPPELQPKGTYNYALNAVMESEGDKVNFFSNEESNKLSLPLSSQALLGHIYINNDELVLLSIDQEDMSEIGIYDLKTETYTKHVTCDLGFDVSFPIDVTFRLRRGCERVIYFTDNLNKPMVYNFDKPYNYKNDSGEFVKEKFYLQKTGSKIPKFRNIEVIDSSGFLKSGAYFIGIQYLDEDLNATDIISTSNKINIYQDKVDDYYDSIGGSIGTNNVLYSKQDTSKSISISLYNLDEDYPFYRLSITSYTSGDGKTSETVFTDKIPTNITKYIYDGKSFTKGTLQEVQQENFIIDKAKNILQHENKLLLSNISGKITDYCSLQKYASQIKSNVVLKEKLLTKMHPGSDKYPTVDLFSLGYMPGEIYSFGIVYHFKDGTKSPVYHIPGTPKNISQEEKDKFNNDPYRFHLSTDNELEITYSKRDKCTDNFWGLDGYGNEIVNKKVRHHRFPLRDFSKEHGFIYSKSTENTDDDSDKEVVLDVTLKYEYKLEPGELISDVPIHIHIEYSKDNERLEKQVSFLALEGSHTHKETIPLGVSKNISIISVTLSSTAPGEVNLILDNDFTFELSTDETYNGRIPTKYAKIYGIEFTNIIKPPTGADGVEIIGYEIVRQERTESAKTILDTGVLTPVMTKGVFNTNFHIFPNMTPFKPGGSEQGNTSIPKINNKYKGLISPEFLFNRQEFGNAKIKNIGKYLNTKTKLIRDVTEDVQSGTSYDSKVNKKSEKDSDGFDLSSLTRVSETQFENISLHKELDVENIHYLDAVSSFSNSENDSKELFNLSCDNRTGFIEFKNELDEDLTSLPYVLLYRKLSNPYQNFLTDRYYKQQLNISEFRNKTIDSITIYAGDSYISPLKYVTSTFVDNRIRDRRKKSGLFKKILGALLIVGAVVASILLPGAGLALSATVLATLTTTVAVAAAQLGVSMLMSGIKQDNLRRAYSDLWDKGLRYTIRDGDILFHYTYPNPPDDQIQWFHEIVEGLWFETNFNSSLRIDADSYGFNYIPPLKPVTDNLIFKYMVNKLTVTDSDRNAGRLYKGFALGEIYELNPDYMVNNYTKFHYPIPYEYDCCSTCREYFPHRVVYSESSFSEELTDNYRKFLPNNYKDISGETGEINNMFVQSNRLYLHTSESLWMQPSTYQERVTNEIVSFIGTGSLLEAPSQRLVDDDTGNSVGLKHKWGSLLTKHGYFFISVGQNKIYNYNGKFEDLGNTGISSFLKYSITNIEDNPLMGIGYTIGYDPKKERILFTKLEDENSWTLSYNLKSSSFRSFHSYIPNRYITTPNDIFSFDSISMTMWKHNIIGSYQKFYNRVYPHILQYTSLINPLGVRNTTEIGLNTITSKYYKETNSFVNIDDISYSKILAFNSKQSLGEKILSYRNEKTTNFFSQSISSHNKDTINIRKADKNWYINNLRDFVVDYTKPLFINNSNLIGLNKDINSSVIDFNKSWTDLSLLKDKYLTVRLTFDNKDNTYKIVTNFTTEDYEQSLR